MPLQTSLIFLIRITLTLILISSLLTIGVESRKNIRRRHFRRQIKESLFKNHSPKTEVEDGSELCKEPEDLKNQMLGWWNENDVYDDSDYLINDDTVQDFDKQTAEKDLNGFESEDAYGSLENEQKICEQPPEKAVDSSIMQRSLCPWQWRLNYNEKREPRFISEAKCLCRKSRGLSGSYCMPIKRKFSVLKRVACNPVTKIYEYVKEVEVITVGCHSVLPRSQRALPISAFYSNSNHEIEVK